MRGGIKNTRAPPNLPFVREELIDHSKEFLIQALQSNMISSFPTTSEKLYQIVTLVTRLTLTKRSLIQDHLVLLTLHSCIYY
jgi:hypothetical protein